jgi:hypothetical protein
MQTHRLAGKPWWQIPSHAGQPTLRWMEPQPPAKGAFNGVCQRHDCTMAPAHWFNLSSGRYVCSQCAHTLNELQRKHRMPAMCELHLAGN